MRSKKIFRLSPIFEQVKNKTAHVGSALFTLNVQIDTEWCGQRKRSHLQCAWLNAVCYGDMVERRFYVETDDTVFREAQEAQADNYCYPQRQPCREHRRGSGHGRTLWP
jgi:hypothetical protein